MRIISTIIVTTIITAFNTINSVEAATLTDANQPSATATKLINTEINTNSSSNTIEKRNFKSISKIFNSRNLTLVSNKQKSNLQLPRLIAGTILQNLSQLTLSPISNFNIIKVESKTWSNGCLDIAPPGEMCTQSMVPGWRVVAFGKNQKWVYHTSDRGAVVLNGLASLPSSLANAVLQQASQKAQLPMSKLSIVWVEPKIWSDSCLNLTPPRGMCTQSMVPGWQVTVSSGTEHWVYHTDLSRKISINSQIKVTLNTKLSTMNR